MSTISNQKNTGQRIAEYVKYQREKRKWTFAEFSSKTGLAISFLLRLEQGEYKTVKFDVIQKLSYGLDMSIRQFLWKCELIETEAFVELPSLEYYLKEKFFLPTQAVEDIKLLMSLLEKKYEAEIAEMKALHDTYWKDKV